MAQVEVKFGEWFERGLAVYKGNFGLLVLSSLILLLLSSVSMGILGGPLAVGMSLLVLRLVDGDPEKPDAGAIFKGFSFFLPSFLFALVWGLLAIVAMTVLSMVPCIGTLAGMALMFGLMTALAFGVFLIGDRGLDFWTASRESFSMVKDNFFPFLGLVVVAGLLAGVGAFLCGIGVVLTAPIYFCIIAVAYRDTLAQMAGEVAEEAEPVPAEDIVSDEPETPPSV